MASVVTSEDCSDVKSSLPSRCSVIAVLSLIFVALTACSGEQEAWDNERCGDLADTGFDERCSAQTDTSVEDTEQADGGEQDADEAPPELASLYALSDDKLHPENGDYDPVTRAFFVGSLGHGNITRIDADGTESIFYEGTGEPNRLTLGIRADVERRRLWVCSMLDDGIEPGQVWVLDLDDASMVHQFDLPDVYEDASCNDVDVDSRGRAYVTDRQNPNIYRIDLDDESVEVWATDDLLAPEMIGLNGVVVTPDEEALVVTKFYPPRLLRISMEDPSDVTEVAFTGDPFQGTVFLSGADGIALDEEVLYVAFTDAVMRLEFDDQWRQAHVYSKSSVHDGLAAIIIAEGSIYTVRGEVIAFALDQQPDLPFEVRRINPNFF